MAKYLVGYGHDTWDLLAAYQDASDGDTIEFQKGFTLNYPQLQHLTIEKNLIFLGSIEQTPQGTKYHTTLKASWIIGENVTVTFKQLWLTLVDDSSLIYAMEGSEVFCDRVVMKSQVTDATNYAVVAQNAKITLQSVTAQAGINDIGILSESSLTIRNSRINTCVRLNDNSTLEVYDSTVMKQNANTLDITNSHINCFNSTFKGGSVESDYPCVYLSNANGEMEKCTITQDNYSSALYLENRSHLTIETSHISSINANNSHMLLSESTIDSIIQAGNYAFIESRGTLDMKALSEKFIDIYCFNRSVFLADTVKIVRALNNNIILDDVSICRIERITSTHNLEVGVVFDEDSYYLSTDTTSQKKEEHRVEKSASQTQNLDDNTSAREKLNQLIGLKQVKTEIQKLLSLVDFNNRRIAQGLKPEKQSLHAVFMGNSGTGKTTVARLIGEVLFESGALSGETFTFVEATESDLISMNVGGTAIQTYDLLEKAKGGILFIDEAYTLNKKDASVNFGQEAINTILKYMEDHRDDIMIIFAGYTKEMEQFLQTNPGLASRVPNIFVFEDYTSDEIVAMGEQILEHDEYHLEDRDYYARQVARSYAVSLDKSNGRWIRNFNQKLTRTLANRAIAEPNADLGLILNRDIDDVLNQGKFEETHTTENALDKLNELIGIPKVKEQVLEFISLVELNQKRDEQGYKTKDFSLHSLFLGNPGTGKTTVARIVGKVLYQKGVISQNKFIEASRSDLVAGYVGQTAIKTREVLESALGGVLFIDEAYSLSSGSDNDFGQEAIDEILKFMEDHRRDIVIIFAGYTKEMAQFLASNSGLRSRIPTTFDFEDYTPTEIAQIGLLDLAKSEYDIDKAYYTEIVEKSYVIANDHSNGRWVRNFNEKLIRVLSTRLLKTNATDYNTILNEDIDIVGEVYRRGK